MRNASCRIRHHVQGSLRKAVLPLSALLLIIIPVCVDSADHAVKPAMQDIQLAAATTKEELLLFWEEKDLYVQSATRHPKPISRAAENIAVVTAKEIEEMNAHSVEEILNRVPGVYVDFQGQDFSPVGLIHIQGSIQSAEDRHVAVYLDGVPMNNLSGGTAVTTMIPVRIIDRIEIVKGPASSTWGSALGGVVNIITKDQGVTRTPKATVSASYGEKNSQDYNGELFGRPGSAGYYLFAGWQDSDGLRDHRATEKNRAYAKVGVTPSRDLDLLFSAGYGDHFSDSGDNPVMPTRSGIDLSVLFATGSFNYRVSPRMSLKGALHYIRQKFDSSSFVPATDQLRRETITDDRTSGGNLKLVHAGDRHTVVAGAEFGHGTLQQTIRYGPQYQSPPYNQPSSTFVEPRVDKWALFVNDTIVAGRLAVTPGVRLDRNNVSGTFLSPSMGATFSLGEHTVARASVARGFTAPPLVFILGGGFFIEPNPALEPERVWSYQAGLESAVTEHANVKVTLFRHESTKEIVTERVASRPPFKVAVNSGEVTRNGYEIETETAPFYNISLKAAHAYVRVESDSTRDPRTIYSFHAGVMYDDRKHRTAQLAGTYVNWDEPADSRAVYAFLWDFNFIERIRAAERTNMDLFLTVHNVTNSDAYSLYVFPNPGRWVEAGLRLRF
ncbi:MAG: TonB-dependent receptor [Deltaproteobacteria bacterium]|nr:TonB-dependent receptor [Deltaproteobacteria bacterium]